MPVLKTLVDDHVKAGFKARAHLASLSESDLLRTVVLGMLGPAVHEPPPADMPDAPGIDQLTVRMRATLLQRVRTRAKAMGMSASRWIAALVQSNMSNAPVMSESEVEVLRASNRELAALGRNINKIVREIRAGGRHDGIPSDQCEALLQAISRNREAIQELIDASQRSWGARP